MNKQQIESLLLDRFGTVPVRLDLAADGQKSIVWIASLPDRDVIVRLHDEPRMYATTENNLRILAGLGLPVPRVLASDISGHKYPFGYLILEKISGRDLRHELGAMTKPQMTRLAEQIAGFQRTVGTLPEGTGYGWVGIGEPGPYGSWMELLGPGHDTASGMAESKIVSEAQRRLRRVTDQMESYLRRVPPTCFLDDITVKNVMMENGELQGLVDFDCVCYGDPLHWLGLTATVVVCDVGLRELFYVDELFRLLDLTPEGRRAGLFYCALIAFGFVERYAASETPEWRARMLHAVEMWLDEWESN